MRFVGGGIGHKLSDHIQQSTMAPNYIEDDAHDGAQDKLEDAFLHKTQDQTQADKDVNADRDLDEVDADDLEEANYSYVDDSDSNVECASDESEDSDDEAENGDEYNVL